MVVASKERAFTPEALRRSGKPTLLAQAGIHAGEIDGKDAGLMLLRDMTVRGTQQRAARQRELPVRPDPQRRRPRALLGASRASTSAAPRRPAGGPTPRNLNLNRDYAKLDALEMRAVVAAHQRLAARPLLRPARHRRHRLSVRHRPSAATAGAAGRRRSQRWLDGDAHARRSTADLRAMGHTPGPAGGRFTGRSAPAGEGIVAPIATPRFSTGYGDARHLPTLLVENHSLKPYDQRVLGTYVLLENTLRRARSARRPACAQPSSEDRRSAGRVGGARFRAAALRRVPQAPWSSSASSRASKSSPVTGGKRVVCTRQARDARRVPVLRLRGQPERQAAAAPTGCRPRGPT